MLARVENGIGMEGIERVLGHGMVSNSVTQQVRNFGSSVVIASDTRNLKGNNMTTRRGPIRTVES